VSAHDEYGSAAPAVPRETAGEQEFLAGVRAALADLPAAEVAEIVDDVRAHLVELRAESGVESEAESDAEAGGVPGAGSSLAALTARLGTPEAYASELRTAAGYPPAPRPVARPGRGAARLAVVGLVLSALVFPLAFLVGEPVLLLGVLGPLLALPALVRGGPGMSAVAALPLVRSTVGARPAPGSAGRGLTDFVASLQPAWWVLRALVAVALVAAVLGEGGLGAGLLLVGLLALVALPVSVWLGRHSRRDRRWVWLVVPLNGLAVVLALAALADVAPLGGPGAEPSPVEPWGLSQDGEQVTDLRPFDAAGRPLTGVYLFDQGGRPVDAVSDVCDDGTTGPGPQVFPRPYPRGSAVYDDVTGRCTIVPPAPLVVAVPTAAPTGPTPPAPAPGPAPSDAPVPPSPAPTR
jgi:uncharacterized membrane protein